MSARFRLLAIVTAMMIAFSISGIAIAQSDFPDPDSPVQDRTPTPEDEEEEEDPTPTEEDTPTEEPDETPTEEPEDTATPEPEDTATEEPEETPTEAAEETPADDAEATPPGGGRPVAAGEDLPLAAMTLDDTTISGEYQLFFERYTTPEEMSDSVVNLVTVEELLATGLIAQYTSYYFNEDGNSIRTYVLAFETIQGVRGGFNLVEDEERLVPNGALTDLPPLEGVGEAPGEITTGQIEEGDGTQTGTYDVTFRMDRYLVGAAMETYDGSEPDTDLVDSMAADLAERIDLILSGEMPDGIDYALPGRVIELGGDVLIEGYQTGQEAFLITDPDDVPEGYLSGYYRAATFSRNIQTVLPFVTVGVSTFESADDVEAALLDLDELTPLFPDIEELDGVEVDTADDVQAVSYSSPDGEGEPDSVRVFVQVEAKLLVIDVQGLDSVDDAEDAAVEYAQAQVNCVLDGDCDDPGVIEFE